MTGSMLKYISKVTFFLLLNIQQQRLCWRLIVSFKPVNSSCFLSFLIFLIDNAVFVEEVRKIMGIVSISKLPWFIKYPEPPNSWHVRMTDWEGDSSLIMDALEAVLKGV